jgi:hypothetical protein
MSPDINPQDIDIVDQKLRDAALPGFEAIFTLDEAAEAGAFQETALTEVEAKESIVDNLL